MTHAIKLRPVLFLLILLAGVVPLVISTLVLTKPNRDLLRTQEQTDLTRTAESLSNEVDDYLVGARRELELLGAGLLAAPGPADVGALLQEEWVNRYLLEFAEHHGDWRTFAIVDDNGRGPQFSVQELSAKEQAQLQASFDLAAETGRPAYRFVQLDDGREPSVVVTVPVAASRQQEASGEAQAAGGEAADGQPDEEQTRTRRVFLEAVLRPQRLLQDLAMPSQGPIGGEVFLIDRQGELVWSSVASPQEEKALLDSGLVQSFVARPMPLTEIYEFEVEGRSQRVIAIVSPIEEPGWGVVAHRPEKAAFLSVRRLLLTALISFLLLVLLALLLAYVASAWIGQPVQRLAKTTHAIAQGDFSSRVDTTGMRFELADLAEDFNLMGGTVERYVAQLQEAAQANRDLFIGSLRAFTAAIDAKDPYTRGHSERVAAAARTIARTLGLSEDVQGRLWIAALLHDVGKIGVDDRILKKGGVLSPDEYLQMQKHTVIGAEIMTPIDQLKEALPVIRWHHENWNGKGYPDGLKGEKIPLLARIVAVADTFDAITTNRPYQNAYDLEYAVATITKLTGSRFDAKVVTAFIRAVERNEITIRPTPANESLNSGPASASGTG